MDDLEVIVNQRTTARSNFTRNTRVQRQLKRIWIAAGIAVAMLVCALLGLVHPGLAFPVMVVSLMVGSYHLGRCALFVKRRARR